MYMYVHVCMYVCVYYYHIHTLFITSVLESVERFKLVFFCHGLDSG